MSCVCVCVSVCVHLRVVMWHRHIASNQKKVMGERVRIIEYGDVESIWWILGVFFLEGSEVCWVFVLPKESFGENTLAH